MKKVLSLLLSFAFLQAQSWAIGGGPGGGTTTATAIAGTYSGVLLPAGQTNPSIINQASSASIGLFSVGVPSTGIATGAAVAFVDGVAYIGDMIGVADPQKNTLVGIVEATSNFDVVTLIPVVDPVTGQVTFQQVTTKVFAQGNIQTRISGSGFAESGNIRLFGKAELDLFATINPDGTPAITNTVKFQVDGFKQSDSVTNSTIDLNNGPGDPTNP